jgi:Cdc6-like AAA superfamily ATPase
MSEPAREYNKALNRLLMRVTRRAEKSTVEYLTRTFVPVEPVPVLLESVDNQVIYGRRGTGKTHLLKYIAELISAPIRPRAWTSMTF